MKKIIAALLSLTLLLSACTDKTSASLNTEEKEEGSIEAFQPENDSLDNYSFTGLDDDSLLQYIEDQVYTDLITELNSDQYFIENVNAVYISKEYLEETAYNSQTNVFFGYSLAELDEYFGDTKYVFTVNNEGETIVQQMDIINDADIYDQIIKNVAIGAGIIIVTVTVSFVTAGLGAPAAVTAICAASAASAQTFAFSGAVFSSITAGAVKLYQTQDADSTLKAAALAGANGLKWGAISGAVVGGATEAIGLKIATKAGLTMNEAAIVQQESKWPLEIIKQIKSMEEYNVYIEDGLYTKMVNGKITLVQDIDLDYISELPDGSKITNLARMRKGLAPLDPVSGEAYELHHINQGKDASLAILKRHTHQKNAGILNTTGKESEIDRNAFYTIRKQFWKQYAEQAVK